MKKLTLMLVTIVISFSSISQTPQAFKYQAVVRDNSGNILANQNVSFQISILQGSASGASVCTETYDATTNEFGLVNLEIGNGEPGTGSFTDIDWGDGLYFLQIEMDETGGPNYLLMGTSQLLSVPYALYSDSSGNTGATQIDELTDGRTIGNSVFLGSGAGVNDDGTDNRNVAVGIDALKANTSGDYNTANGTLALYSNTTGYKNTANGYRALFSNTEGFYNTANGYHALYSNTIGSYNTATGNQALYFDTTGNANTANGFQALHFNTTGYRNTAVGYRVLFSNTEGYRNTANGYAANYYNEEGSNNTIIGYGAGMGTSPHNKSGNVFLGYLAGYNEHGSNKLYIDNSDTTAPLIYGEFDNDILAFNANVGIGTTDPEAKLEVRGSVPDDGPIFKIGNSDGSHSLSFFPGRENDPNPFIQWKEGDPLRFSTDEGGWSEKMRITSDGNVGIGTGTTNPLSKLDVAGVITTTGGNSTNWNSAYGWGDHSTAGYFTAESDPQVGITTINKWCVGNGVQINAIADPPVLVEVDPKIGTISNNMVPKWDGTKLVSGTIYNGGYVGIGTTSPTHILHVTGIARSAQSTWATSSDARVKENIHKIEGSLAVIEQLRPVSYNYKNDYVRDNQAMAGMQRGFVAQEVKEVLPEMVTTCTESFAGKTIKDFHLLNTSDLTPFLVAAMQEQQELIRKLERRIDELEKR
jgi:hypothetical protein